MHCTAARYDVIRARKAGLKPKAIEALTGISSRSQRRIAYEEVPFGMSDQQLHLQVALGRPSVLGEELRNQIGLLLQEDPSMKGTEVLRRLRSEFGYLEGKNPVYRHLEKVRPRRPAALPVVRFEGVAGEFCQHDFGKLRIGYLDGSSEMLRFFASRLKFSRMLCVCLMEGETAEGLIRGMEAAARVFGGLPLLQVIDNTKAGVIDRIKDPQTGKERIRYHRHFSSFLQEVGVLAEPTYPYSGNQKGPVENLVRFVKEGFFTARRFRHREDLLMQLREWMNEVNTRRECQATKEIPVVRLAREASRLKPLPFDDQGFGLPYEGVVGKDAFVHCLGVRYSAPARWIGQPVTVRVHVSTVVLQHDGQRVAHPRTPSNGRYSLLDEHRAALFVKPRGALVAKRQILMDLCDDAELFFTELVHRRPQSWRENDMPLIWELFETRGEQHIRDAFSYCLAHGAIGAEYLHAFASGLTEVAP